MNSESPLRYFAYGSNLWWPRLRGRVPSAERVSAACLYGFELQFRKIGGDGSAKADLRFTGQRSHVVHGVIYAIAAEDLPALDRIEGGYHRASVRLDHAGGTLWAFTYLASEPAAQPFAPFDWYRELILAGGHDHRLPKSYLHKVAAVETVPDSDRDRHGINWPQRLAAE